MVSDSTGTQMKTVAVLGAAYGGNRAAQILAAGLPEGWRIVLVDRNTRLCDA
ncbi:cytochrome b [Marasmius tenuissimus]|nr:cytochrome b [Marasmius tenuissimus]